MVIVALSTFDKGRGILIRSLCLATTFITNHRVPVTKTKV